jgi:hypothetical protein
MFVFEKKWSWPFLRYNPNICLSRKGKPVRIASNMAEA